MDFEWNNLYLNKYWTSDFSSHLPNAFPRTARSALDCALHSILNATIYLLFPISFVHLSQFCAHWVFISIWSFARFHFASNNLCYSINGSVYDMICKCLTLQHEKVTERNIRLGFCVGWMKNVDGIGSHGKNISQTKLVLRVFLSAYYYYNREWKNSNNKSSKIQINILSQIKRSSKMVHWDFGWNESRNNQHKTKALAHSQNRCSFEYILGISNGMEIEHRNKILYSWNECAFNIFSVHFSCIVFSSFCVSFSMMLYSCFGIQKHMNHSVLAWFFIFSEFRSNQKKSTQNFIHLSFAIFMSFRTVSRRKNLFHFSFSFSYFCWLYYYLFFHL